MSKCEHATALIIIYKTLCRCQSAFLSILLLTVLSDSCYACKCKYIMNINCTELIRELITKLQHRAKWIPLILHTAGVQLSPPARLTLLWDIALKWDVQHTLILPQLCIPSEWSSAHDNSSLVCVIIFWKFGQEVRSQNTFGKILIFWQLSIKYLLRDDK